MDASTEKSDQNWIDYLAYLSFASLPFRDLRLINFISLQDVFLTLLFVTILFSNRTKPKVNTRYLICLVFLGLILLLQSMLVSEDLIANNLAVFKVITAYFILPLILYLYCDRNIKVHYLCYSFIFGNTFANLLLLFGIKNVDSNGRFLGFSGHAIFAGTANALSIILIFALYATTKTWFLTSAVVIPFSIYGLTIAISSTSYIILIFGLSILGFQRAKAKNILTRIFSFVLLFFTFSFFVLTLNIFESAQQRFFESINPTHAFTLTTSDNSTFLARVYSLRYSWYRIENQMLLGNGFDQDGRLTQIGLEPHNIFFMAWQTGGILFFFFVIIIAINSLSAIFFNMKTLNRISTVLLTASWVTLLTGPALYDRSILAPLFLGLISSRNTRNRVNL